MAKKEATGIITWVWDELKDLRGRRRPKFDILQTSRVGCDRASQSLAGDHECLFLDREPPDKERSPDRP